MIGAFLVGIIAVLWFRAIGTSTDKKKPADRMWEMMKEDGEYIIGIVLFIVIVLALIMII